MMKLTTIGYDFDGPIKIRKILNEFKEAEKRYDDEIDDADLIKGYESALVGYVTAEADGDDELANYILGLKTRIIHELKERELYGF